MPKVSVLLVHFVLLTSLEAGLLEIFHSTFQPKLKVITNKMFTKGFTVAILLIGFVLVANVRCAPEQVRIE